ncbi:F-box/LRR-repeat protein 17-like [Melia azedarach]|uniref:F-box/LRR-repeat protein 17-like n=1 Tax=Melia azedarach TaxID=155640 RepID=A0ACC1YWF3_MELAZ|nr:F-box/LRR-repeat protein 17-like [Melia azedarach]
MNRQHQPHVSPSATDYSSFDFNVRPSKRRGSYNCGRCGLPKKGHNCNISTPTASTPSATPTPSDSSAVISAPTSLSASRPPRHQHYSHLRRALSFDNIDLSCESPEPDSVYEETVDPDPIVSGGLPAGVLWEVLRRLPPAGLLAAAKVCKGWRETTRRLWRAAEELRLRVPMRAQVGFIGSILQKCPSLVRLSLRMESDVDATMLACIAFSCPNLESMEIYTADTAINRITGDELGRFVADKRCLTSLKMEGCSNLGGFVLCSSSLSTLWLSDLYSLSKMIFNSAGLRGLRMLSLVLGSEITDASVAAIASTYSKLELLDLSGSSISDSGIGMICNVFPNTLSRLLLALCPNITSSGIQFATAQLPLLELMDCGMSICDPNSQDSNSDENCDVELQKAFNNKLHLIYQKLIIKHCRLKKLSLWGCSGLDALCLNCPELNDLNLNSCRNLRPDTLLLQCPKLESVHASGCQELLIGTVQSQVNSNFAALENQYPFKRSADGSKRIRVPHSFNQASDEDMKRRRVERRLCNVVVD